MKNLSKNTKTLIFSGLGLVVLIIAALILTLNPDEAKNPDDDNITVQNNAIILNECDISDVVRIHVRNQNDEYIIERANENEFYIAKFELLSVPQNQINYGTAARHVSLFRAYDVVEENAENLEQYGLDEASAAWFKAEFADGEAFEVYIGDPTPTTEQMFYVRLAGSNTVYVVWASFVNVFREDKRFFVSLEITEALEGFDMPIVDRLVIHHIESETFVIERIPPVREGEIATSLNIHRMTEPYSVELSFVDSQQLLNGLIGLRASGTAYVGEEIPDDGEIILIVEMTVDNKTTTLEVRVTGDEFELQGIYSEIPNVLYIFEPEALPWLGFNVEELMSKLFFTPNIIYVSELIIQTDEHDLRFMLTEEEFFLNGELVDDSEFRSLYQYCIVAPADAIFRGEADIDELPLLARFTYRYHGGIRADDVIEFYDTGDRRVLVVMNNEPMFSSRIMYITRLKQNIEAYLNGERLIMSW
jgi:hypothetical protein